jgi:hypothetical protein
MIRYVEVNILGMNSRPLGCMTVRRSGATEHPRGYGIISDNVPTVMARHSCGAPSSGDKRPIAFVALLFLKRIYVETRPLLTMVR